VIDELGDQTNVFEIDHAFPEFAEVNARRELIELDRKVGKFHLAGKDVGDGTADAFRCTNGEFVSGLKSGNEEREALDVIPVRVAEEDGGADRL